MVKVTYDFKKQGQNSIVPRWDDGKPNCEVTFICQNEEQAKALLTILQTFNVALTVEKNSDGK